jgi:4-amino-4-deoxy-L-arabinose transferase-like glycosyltransferase
MILSVLIYSKLYPEDKTKKENFFNLLFMNSAIIYSAGAVLMMHDTVMIFFFAFFIYQMLYVLEVPEDNARWAYAGITLGFGVMSKYTLSIIYPAILIFLFFSRFNKKYIKGPIIFSICFLLALSPVICWNIIHNFPTLTYFAARSQSGSKSLLNFKYFFEFAGGQFVIVSIFLIPFFLLSLLKNLKNRGFNPHYMLSILFTVSMLSFIILSFKSRVEANWPAFAFFPLFFITTNYIIKRKSWVKHVIYSAGFLILLIIHTQLIYPIISLPEKADITKKFYGYKELAEKVNLIYDRYRNKGVVFFTARHYQIASALAFYLAGQPQVYILVPHEANKNYRFWDSYKKIPGFNCIYIYQEYWEHDEMRKFFKSSDIVDKIEIKRNNTVTSTFYVDFDYDYLGNQVPQEKQ